MSPDQHRPDFEKWIDDGIRSAQRAARGAEECAHCGRRGQCFARIGGTPVCHVDAPHLDCYRLVTIYGEPLGSRRTTIPADHLGDWLADDYLRGNHS